MKLKGILLAAAATAFLVPMTASADIIVATAGPMTGQNAAFGEQFRRGAEMAVNDINAKGGLLGQQLKLVVGDDACDPKQAVAVANKLVKDGVKFVAGHYCSSSSIPASDVYHEEGVIQVSPGSTKPILTDRGYDNVFRVCGRDDQQGVVAGKYLVDTYKGKNVAILHDKTAYGQGLAEETKKAFNAAGQTEKLFEAYTPGEKDYSSLVTKLKQLGIDAVYVGGYHTEAGLIARQMADQGMVPRIISGDALVTNEYWAITGAAGEGTMMTFGPDLRGEAIAKSVVDAFRKGGYEPEGYTLYTYAAIQIFAAAATKAGSTDMDKVLKVMKSTEFDTVMGKISFDKKGDVTQPAYVWYKWAAGTYAQVK